MTVEPGSSGLARRRAFSIVRPILLVVVLVGVTACSSGHRSGTTRLPDLALSSFDGGTITLDNLVGRPSVVNLWAQSCPPCVAEMPMLDRAARQHADAVRFVGVDTQDDPNRARSFAAELGVSYQLVSDRDGTLQAALHISSIPTTLFVARDGIIRSVHVGTLSDDELTAEIAGIENVATSGSA